MSGLRLIASYPKSGNTRLRLMLWNFCRNPDEPAHINDVSFHSFGATDDSKWIYEDAFGLDGNGLEPTQAMRLRCFTHTHLARLAEARGALPLVKTHTANGFLTNDMTHPYVGWESVHSAVVLVRNPLDVCRSYAHHLGKTIDETADFMGKRNAAGRHNDDRNVFTIMDTWSLWVRSWMQEYCAGKVMLVRFEDMEEAFPEIVKFYDFEEAGDQERIDKAIRFTKLPILRQMEAEDGFKEASPKANKTGFFGGEREPLTDYAREKIIADHGDVMRLFGYL